MNTSISIGKAVAHTFGYTKTWRFGLSLALLLSQFACSANTPIQMHKEKTNPYYVDAQLCRAQNPGKQGEPALGAAASIDETGYLGCMQRLGYQQEAKTDPLLKALSVCQQGSVSYSARGVQATRPQTPAGYRDCLKSRGFSSASSSSR